jgi:uncharacterized protein with PIN domain
MFPTNAPRFACDAMLGALARWLRAAGYEAAWVPHIDDWDLIRLARREQRILLSSDTRLFKIGIVRDGDLPALFVPNGLGKKEQLAFVHCRLHLTALPPRCMACSGMLSRVAKEQARGRVPARSFAWQEEFWICEQCGRVFWKGTHWQGIEAVLTDALRRADAVERAEPATRHTPPSAHATMSAGRFSGLVCVAATECFFKRVFPQNLPSVEKTLALHNVMWPSHLRATLPVFHQDWGNTPPPRFRKSPGASFVARRLNRRPMLAIDIEQYKQICPS